MALSTSMRDIIYFINLIDEMNVLKLKLRCFAITGAQWGPQEVIVEGGVGVEASGEIGHDIQDGIHWDEHDGAYR